MVGGYLRVLRLPLDTTKTGRPDIAEILLKVALKHQKSIQINQILQELSKAKWCSIIKQNINIKGKYLDI